MKKVYRGIVLTVLAVMLVVGMIPAVAFAGSIDPSVGTGAKVEFGSYPQSLLSNTKPTTGTAGVDWVQGADGKYYKVEPITWRVLSNAGGKLFLLADKNLDNVKYNDELGTKPVPWEKSSIRTWLNGTFYNQAFSTEEKTAISTTAVINGTSSNPSYPAFGGDNTEDKVFFLSIAEVQNPAYGFKDNKSRVAIKTAYTAGSWPGANAWWLRSPGQQANYAAIVEESGSVTSNGDNAYSDMNAVRPAINLNISLANEVIDNQIPNSTQTPIVKAIRTPLSKVYIKRGTKTTLPVVIDADKAGIKPTYKSSKPKVATVNASTGKITAKKVGKTTISISAKTVTKKITVNVTKKKTALKNIKVSGLKASYKLGASADVKLKLNPTKATFAKVSFKSSKGTVFTVDKAGRVSFKATGKATLTVKAGSKVYKKTIVVKK